MRDSAQSRSQVNALRHLEELIQSPLIKIQALNKLLTEVLTTGEELTELLYRIRRASPDPYDVRSYDLNEYPYFPENVITSPASLHDLLLHPSSQPIFTDNPEGSEYVFNFVYGFHSLGRRAPVFVFGSRQNQQNADEVNDTDVERGVKHFHLCSSKKVIPVFAGVLHVFSQGPDHVVSITPLSGRWLETRDPLVAYFLKRGRNANLNEFNSQVIHKFAGNDWSAHDLGYLLDAFSTMEMMRMLQKKWKHESITFNPCLLQTVANYFEEEGYINESVCFLDIPSYVQHRVPFVARTPYVQSVDWNADTSSFRRTASGSSRRSSATTNTGAHLKTKQSSHTQGRT